MTMNILTHQSSTILSCSCHLSLCSAWRLRRCITRNEHGDRSMTATLHECHKLWRALGDNHGATKDAAKRPVTGVTPTRSCLELSHTNSMLPGNVCIKQMTPLSLLWSCMRYVAMLAVTGGTRGQTSNLRPSNSTKKDHRCQTLKHNLRHSNQHSACKSKCRLK